MKTRVLDLEMYHEGQEGPYVNKFMHQDKDRRVLMLSSAQYSVFKTY